MSSPAEVDARERGGAGAGVSGQGSAGAARGARGADAPRTTQVAASRRAVVVSRRFE